MAEAHRGRILRLEVTSFKSYRGHNVIGPFKPFTTIIGPNGSGKSNVMDAISFVLGVRTAQLRGSLKELLYHNSAGQTAGDRPRKGGVKLVFEAPDGEELHFERTIKPTGAGADAFTSEYKLNERSVGWEQYNRRLEQYNILVKARNFLVFQGDIENVAQMQPRDLTNLFEHISGSAAYRQQYEELEKRKAEAEEKVTYIFSRKKAITQEKKQKKDQKEEAERHQALQTDLDETRAALYTWQIYHLDQDAKDEGGAVRMLREQLAEAERSQQVAERAAEEKKREQAGLQKERLLLEKKAKKKQADADKRNPEAYKVKEDIARLQRRIKSGEKELGELRRKGEEAEAKVAALQEQLEALEDAQKSLEADAKRQRGKLQLGPELLDEYNRIKQEVKAKTAQMDADLAAQQSGLEAQEQARDMAKEKAESIDARIADLTQQAAEAQARHDTVVMGLAEKERRLQEAKTDLEKAQKEIRHVDSQRNRLTVQLDEVEGQLRDARQVRKESDRDRRLNEAIVQLKAQYKDRVYGRVAHLADMRDKRYRLAVTAAMGKDFDGVVVKDVETAKAAIRLFKEQRLPPTTFIPADEIRVKGVPDALRNQLQRRGVGKLAVDLVAPKQAGLERVFQMLLGTTIITDTTKQAKEIAFHSSQRQKVVSLDGTLINKAGIITGGMHSGLEARAGQWDAGALEELKQRHAQAQEALDALPAHRELVQQQQELQARISGLESDLAAMRVDIKASQDKMRSANTSIAALEKEREEGVAPELERAEDAITEARREVGKLKKRIDEIMDRSFAAFSKKARVPNVREYEETHLAEQQRFAKERRDLAGQVAKVRNQLEYVQRQAKEQREAAATKEGAIERERSALEARQQDEQRFAQESEATQAEIAEVQNELAGKRRELEALEAELKEVKDRVAATKDAVAKYRRSIGARRAAIEDLQAKRGDVLEAARMEQVPLPVLVDGSQQSDDEEEEGADGMDVDGGEGGSGAGPSSAQKQRKVRLDFSGLDAAAKLRDRKNRDAWEKEVLASIEEMRAELSRLAPNLKAVEQYEAIREKEREQLEELEAARRESKAATEAFQTVQQKRYDAFMQAFEHVAHHIDPIYKELTRSQVHASGGQAYLSLDSTDEPFLHGVKFSAMPPTKRFRDMEQLSGGEKTVAALALLFAIHSFQPSPFFVLDEVDAALDATNVVRVANYMRHMTRDDTEGNFQGIVISLKDVFFEKADALVGVCRDAQRGCSETYTFDLERFGPPAGAVA